MKKHAILFGLNYDKTPESKLRGCINDVNNMKMLLESKAYGFDDVRVFTDNDSNNRTTACGFLQEINNLANRSWKEELDVAWIHYSGHGCSVKDWTNDELDGKDECVVPSDYKRAGVVSDDYIKNVLRNFNPRTKVICIFDCCHSGTIGDLKYRYLNESTPQEENRGKACDSKIILISGCMDSQTSADAFNVNNMKKYSGAMTSCLIQSLQQLGHKPEQTSVYKLLERLRINLKEKRFSQIPQLCASFMVSPSDVLL